MEFIGYALIVVGIAAIAYGLLASRRRQAEPVVDDSTSDGDDGIDARLRPGVADFHVAGDEARVTFDVPLPEGGADDVLTDLLKYEAVEVVRSKSHSLPIDQVTTVKAFAGDVEVGSVSLPSAGVLPPELEPPVSLHLEAGDDPLSHTLGSHVDPAAASAPTSDELPGLHPELKIPAAVEARLRAIGIDSHTADAPELVRGLIGLSGYTIEDRDPRTYVARKGGRATFVRNISHGSGDHPELEEREIRAFVAEFVQSGADRGILVTAKYSPHAIYERERTEPRIQFVSRERLQGFVDRMATSS